MSCVVFRCSDGSPAPQSASTATIDVARYTPGPIRLTRKHPVKDKRAEMEKLVGKEELRDDEDEVGVHTHPPTQTTRTRTHVRAPTHTLAQ